MLKLAVLLLAACLLLPSPGASHRILGIFPHGARSHFNMVEALMEGLARRGHDVVVVSPFPRSTPLDNYTDISLAGTIPILTSEIPLENVGDGNVGTTIGVLFHLGFDACERVLSLPNVLRLAEVKFDLIVYEMFNTDCFLALVRKFDAPFIAVSSSAFMPWHNERFGNVDNPSYVPVHFLPHSDRMGYRQRCVNAAYYAAMRWATRFYLDAPTDEIVRRRLGETTGGGPSLREIAANTSLLLLNTHFTLNRPRPFVPAIIEVGGIHIKKPPALPPNIAKFLDEAKDGVIYFSFGSTVKSSTFPADKRVALVRAFAQLPQRVIWKWEGELPGRPDNVMVDKWLPQMAILNHPNVRAFITHAGLMGSIEAVAAGVPMVGIPLFGDQPLNMAALVENRVAVKLDYLTITEETVLRALRTVLEDPSYAENSRRLAEAFNDRPLSPLDTAIYWTEYVIKHRGAPHLKVAAVDLAWYEYLLLDVLAPVALAAILVTLVTYLMVRKLFVCVFGSLAATGAPSQTPAGKKQKQKKH